MIFVLQDKNGDRLDYIGSFTTKAAAADLLRELEEQDRRDGIYDPDRYVINRRGICYSDESKTCGNCKNCICMLEAPDVDCPKVKKRAAALAAGDGNQQMLQPAT